MTVLKVVEVLSNSDVSWEDAAKKAVQKAAKSLHGIRSVNVQNMSALVENDKIVEYRINAKLSFQIDTE